jgi:hypothetical protein
MLDREIGLTGPDPEKAAQIPAACEAQVERERTVHQPDHGTDVLAEIRQHEGGVGEDARVVLGYLECLPSEIAGLAAVRLRLFGPAVNDEPQMADRRPRQCRAVMGIDGDCPLQQSQSIENPLLRVRIVHCKCAKVEIISAQVARRAIGRARSLGGLQCWLNDSSDARRNPVLKIEHVFQRAVEAIGPQMRAAQCID